MDVKEKAKSEIILLSFIAVLGGSSRLGEGIDIISERGFASSGGISLLIAIVFISLGIRGMFKAKQWSGSK